jgi:hypothetical protein
VGKAEKNWSLFVDESGDFADPAECVAVAGLLLAEDIPGYSSPEIKEILAKALPGFPWPLHACFVNQLAYVGIAASQRPKEALEAARPGLSTVVEQAVAEWQAREPARLNGVAGQIKAGRKPSVADLAVLGDGLRRARPQLAAALQDVAREGWRAMNLVAERLVASKSSDGHPLTAFLAASETTLGDAGATAADRYFGLLRALTERAAAVIARHPGQHRLGLYVQQLDVFDTRLGIALRLTPQRVGEAINQLRALHPKVRLTVLETSDFGPNVTVEYVLADFLANRSRRHLSDFQGALDYVEDRVGEYFGAPLRSGHPVRSHLSASGEAFASVLAAAAGRKRHLPWQGARRRWACEQANQWAGVR